MRCPFCKNVGGKDNTKVIDSRLSGEGFIVRRRRECLECARRFTTYEKVEERPLRVIKKDGAREPFDRAKVLKGLEIACQKRPVAAERLEEITDEIEREIREVNEREVKAKMIGELVMNKLRRLDDVAYIRFASVYRDFKEISDFLEELRPLMGPEASGAHRGRGDADAD